MKPAAGHTPAIKKAIQEQTSPFKMDFKGGKTFHIL
jgi:hypothetical protein